jgi:hypothetical protein
VPFETAAAPWKRLSPSETAPPPGISPIASIPVLKAPLAIAFVTHGFLYHGVGGAALMVSPLFAATKRRTHQCKSRQRRSIRAGTTNNVVRKA